MFCHANVNFFSDMVVISTINFGRRGADRDADYQKINLRTETDRSKLTSDIGDPDQTVPEQSDLGLH